MATVKSYRGQAALNKRESMPRIAR